jgi:hypothetical protein
LPWSADVPRCLANALAHHDCCDDRVVPDRFYELPLSDDYLVLLGRQARAAGAIELTTKWLLRALLNPRDVNEAASRVRGLQYARTVQLIRDITPARADAMEPDTRFHFLHNITSWLDAADEVMRKRNAYLHGYWLPPDEESPLPGYWDRRQQRTPMDLATLTAEITRAEEVEDGGAIMLRQSLEWLGCPRPAPTTGEAGGG